MTGRGKLWHTKEPEDNKHENKLKKNKCSLTMYTIMYDQENINSTR